MRRLVLGNGVPEEGDGGVLKLKDNGCRFRDDKSLKVMEVGMEVRIEWTKLRLYRLR